MLWMKAFHIIAMVAWFAGLAYLPRLFVYHCQVGEDEKKAYARFCVMERKLFWGIMTPSALITVLLGLGLMHSFSLSFKALPLWLSLKLCLVGILLVYHALCGVYVRRFKQHQNNHSQKFYRIFNEISMIILMFIVLLVVLKPL